VAARKITNVGFLNEFVRRHEQMKDRPFCWVLGSGASVQSGIPTGGKLAAQWLTELHEMEDGGQTPIEEWATPNTLDIADFDYKRAASFYPWIYHRRFFDYKEQGYAFLEKAMEKAEPSFGYSVLAQIMATTTHNVAVTTNFDNLLADALAIYTRTFPLVCGHESLTGYIRPNLRRPLIAKIHRDLLLAPLSRPEEISNLPGEWSAALAKIFSRFTPIVIGYGGNDGSLMGFLEKLEPIEGGIFWCFREGDDLDDAVNAVVERHRGKLVPIAGFDELMLQLQEKLQLPSLLPQLQSVHDRRCADYQKQFDALTAALRRPGESPAAEAVRAPARKAAQAAAERLTNKSWWRWELKARAEEDPAKREQIYRAGLEENPDSSELAGNFATFLTIVRRKYAEAERMYQHAINLDPRNFVHLGNYGSFHVLIREDLTGGEEFVKRALALFPDDPISHSAYAQLLAMRGDYVQARRHALQAWNGHARPVVRAELALTLWFVAKILGEDERTELSRLKTLLRDGFSRYFVLDRFAEALIARIPEDQRPFTRKVVDAVLDETKVEELEKDPAWKAIEVPMDPS
jgi:protein O-mannosyl-transferase